MRPLNAGPAAGAVRPAPFSAARAVVRSPHLTTQESFHGIRHDRGDPEGVAEQVRDGPRTAPDPTRPRAVHLDGVPGRLRLRGRDARPRRGPAGRPGPYRRADISRLRDRVPGRRHVLHGRRARPRREGAVCAGARPTLRGPAEHRGRPGLPAAGDHPLLRGLQGPEARHVRRRLPLGGPGADLRGDRGRPQTGISRGRGGGGRPGGGPARPGRGGGAGRMRSRRSRPRTSARTRRLPRPGCAWRYGPGTTGRAR